MCVVLGLSGAAAAGTVPASTVDSSGPGEWKLAVGPAAGVMVLDPHLADYRWDTRPAAQAGLQAMVERGRFALGGRFWRAHTTQASGIPGETQAPRVNLTGVEMVGSVRALRYRAFELWGTGQAGRFHIGYDPDQLSFDVGGTIGTITVDYEPITEWEAGLGLELRAELTHQLYMSVQGEGMTFSLDTAHRSGSEIVESRERFVTWSLRMQVSWVLSLG